MSPIMRTRSQGLSPGDVVALEKEPRKRSRKRAREPITDDEHDDQPEPVAKRHQLAVTPQSTRATQPTTAVRRPSTTPVQTTEPTPAPHPTTTPQTTTRFGLFGSLSRSVSRFIASTFAIQEDGTGSPPHPEKAPTPQSHSSGFITHISDDTSFNPIAESTLPLNLPPTPTPIRSDGTSEETQAQTEPRPRKRLFPSYSTPRSYGTHKSPYSTYKSSISATAPRPKDTIENKQRRWRLGWEQVPLNKITDPRSIKQRADEAKEAEIDLAEHDFYEPGTEPKPQNDDIVQSERATTPEENTGGKKRKRPPPLSPGKSIPNPPGVSYGMDLRYFDLDYDSDASDSGEEEVGPDEPKQPKSVLKKSTENSFERIQRSTKRVKFDNSPHDTPSKERARAKYTGIHFSEAPNAFIAADNELSSSPQGEPSTFIPRSHHPSPSTFCLPDEWSDESGNVSQESSGMSGVEFGDQSNVEQSNVSLPEPPTTDFHAPQHLETPKKPNEDLSPLSKARQSAERYKPKSPSMLRTSTKIASSSPSNPSTLTLEDEEENNEFSNLSWPAAPTFSEAGICTQEVADLLETLWTPQDDVRASEWFDREFAAFQAADRTLLV